MIYVLSGKMMAILKYVNSVKMVIKQKMQQ